MVDCKTHHFLFLRNAVLLEFQGRRVGRPKFLCPEKKRGMYQILRYCMACGPAPEQAIARLSDAGSTRISIVQAYCFTAGLLASYA